MIENPLFSEENIFIGKNKCQTDLGGNSIFIFFMCLKWQKEGRLFII